MSIVYAREQSLSVADYVTVVGETTMRDRRPIANTTRIGEMLAGANFIVTAREDGAILGLARCITDFAWIAARHGIVNRAEQFKMASMVIASITSSVKA